MATTTFTRKQFDLLLKYFRETKNVDDDEQLISNENILGDLGLKYLAMAHTRIGQKGMIYGYCTKTDKGTQYHEYIYESLIDPVTRKPLKDQNGKRRVNYDKVITHKSSFSNAEKSNCVFVFTGKEHGRFIGLDIDVKHEGQEDNLEKYDKFCEENDIDTTFTTITKSGGKHYIYRVTEEQAGELEDYKNTQDTILGKGFDILYNLSRFITSGILFDRERYKNRKTKITDDEKAVITSQIEHLKLTPEEKKDYIRYYKPWIKLYVVTLSKEPIDLPESLFNMIVKSKPKTKVIKEIPKKSIKQDDPKPMPISKDKVDRPADNNKLEKAKFCIYNIDKSHCNEYAKWQRVMWIFINEELPYDVFDEWSKTSPDHYDCTKNRVMWDFAMSMCRKEGGLTIATLIDTLKKENPEKFKDFQEKFKSKDSSLKVVDRILRDGITHQDASDLFHANPNTRDTFRHDVDGKFCISANKYNIWSIDTSFDIVRFRLGDCQKLLPNRYEELLKSLEEKDEEDKIKENKIRILTKNYKRVMDSLKSVPFTQLSCKQLLHPDNYSSVHGLKDKLNNVNPYIFPFTNGVYDLENNVFRLAKPEEYVSITCGYDYVDIEKTDEETKSILNETIAKLKEKIREIFISERDMDVLLMEISRCLDARPIEEAFYAWIGKGRNGKGVLSNMIEGTFGNMYGVLSGRYFSQSASNTQKSSADSELAAIRHCRFVAIPETPNDVLAIDPLKALSGQDTIVCRDLFEKVADTPKYTIKFRIFFLSNYDLNISDKDKQSKAIIERVKIRKFEYTFNDNPKGDKQKKIDRSLKGYVADQRNMCNLAFFYILLEYYKRWKKHGHILRSKKFEEDTRKYLDGADNVGPFMKFLLNNEILTNMEKDIPKKRAPIATIVKFIREYYDDYSRNNTLNAKDMITTLREKLDYKIVASNGLYYISGYELHTDKFNTYIRERQKREESEDHGREESEDKKDIFVENDDERESGEYIESEEKKSEEKEEAAKKPKKEKKKSKNLQMQSGDIYLTDED